jgi:hypothetical protein
LMASPRWPVPATVQRRWQKSRVWCPTSRRQHDSLHTHFGNQGNGTGPLCASAMPTWKAMSVAIAATVKTRVHMAITLFQRAKIIIRMG